MSKHHAAQSAPLSGRKLSGIARIATAVVLAVSAAFTLWKHWRKKENMPESQSYPQPQRSDQTHAATSQPVWEQDMASPLPAEPATDRSIEDVVTEIAPEGIRDARISGRRVLADGEETAAFTSGMTNWTGTVKRPTHAAHMTPQ